jgi:hypothetical protein
MLTQAQAQGINLDGVLENTSGMNLDAVRQMLDERLAPLTAQQQREADTQEATAAATAQYNNFTSIHPDVVVHETAIARLLQETPDLGLEGAYLKLQNFYLQKGLDWTKSLETLQQEHDAGQVSGVTERSQPPEGGINTSSVTDTPEVANVNVSTADNVKAAMAEAGYKF